MGCSSSRIKRYHAKYMSSPKQQENWWFARMSKHWSAKHTHTYVRSRRFLVSLPCQGTSHQTCLDSPYPILETLEQAKTYVNTASYPRKMDGFGRCSRSSLRQPSTFFLHQTRIHCRRHMPTKPSQTRVLVDTLGIAAWRRLPVQNALLLFCGSSYLELDECRTLSWCAQLVCACRAPERRFILNDGTMNGRILPAVWSTVRIFCTISS